MASLLMKSTMFKVSKAGFSAPQLPSLFPNKVSRVCFTTPSRNQNQYPSSGADEDAKAAERMREARLVYENDAEAEEVERKYQDMKQRAQGTVNDMKEKAKEGAHQAGEAMQEAKDNVKQNAKMAKDKTSDAMHETKEWAKDTADWTADKTREGAGKTAEAMHNVGEKAKETVKGAWETAKGATQKIKETVVGKDEDDKSFEDYMEDHTPKRPGDSQLPSRPVDARDQHLHRDGP